MIKDLQEIEQKALCLPATERELLANHLFQSVHNQELNEVDSAWLSLAEDRWNSYQSNPHLGITKNDFFTDIRKSLGWT
ncbi:MAG: addiction module protein [Opitutaceae bacterium]|nr:addiction module protein [Opitutaceae bacterium]